MKNMRVLKKIAYFILTIFLIINNITQFAVFAATNDDLWVSYNGDYLGQSGFVIEANSGVILYENNPDVKMYPASLTKIMTALVVFDKVANLDETLVFSYNAVTNGLDKKTTTIGASSGDRLSIKDCLYAILLPSANDAANALAEHVAGNIRDFVSLMNEKAEKLGMTNSHFKNPTGLHDDEQYTTARDLSIMMSYAMKNPTFVQMSSSLSYRHAPIRRYKDPENSNNVMLNTNSMLATGSGYYYRGILAGKTGFTNEAGYNLIECVERNNLRLIFVDLGCKKINDRFIDAKNIFNYYFENYKALLIKDYDYRFSNENDYNMSINDVVLVKSLQLTVDDHASVTLPKSIDFSALNSNIAYVVTDLTNKSAIGTITYTLDNKQVGSCSLIGADVYEEDRIYTSYLNLSRVEDSEKVKSNSEKEIYVNPDRPIYIDENGKIRLSRPVMIMIVIILTLIFIYLIYRFFTSNYFLTFNNRMKRTIHSSRKKKII